MGDSILIDQLELEARIGITEEERARPQRLTATVHLHPARGFAELGDRIENAVDYFDVCVAVKAVAAQRPRNLIETLAGEIADALLSGFALSSVEIELRKFVLPDTAFVGVRIRRPS